MSDNLYDHRGKQRVLAMRIGDAICSTLSFLRAISIVFLLPFAVFAAISLVSALLDLAAKPVLQAGAVTEITLGRTGEEMALDYDATTVCACRAKELPKKLRQLETAVKLAASRLKDLEEEREFVIAAKKAHDHLSVATLVRSAFVPPGADESERIGRGTQILESFPAQLACSFGFSEVELRAREQMLAQDPEFLVRVIDSYNRRTRELLGKIEKSHPRSKSHRSFLDFTLGLGDSIDLEDQIALLDDLIRYYQLYIESSERLPQHIKHWCNSMGIQHDGDMEDDETDGAH